jgi:peroxiredoxin
VKKKAFVFTILGLIVVLLAVSLVQYWPALESTETGLSTRKVARGSVSINSPAPVFTLPMLTGLDVNLDDYLGRVVILNFWATWCRPCREEMPVLNEFGLQHPDSVVVVGISVNDSPDSVQRFIQELPVSYPILIDATGVVGAAYHVVGYPTTYFLDAEGIIRGKFVGTLTPRVLQQNLTPLGIVQ